MTEQMHQGQPPTAQRQMGDDAVMPSSKLPFRVISGGKTNNAVKDDNQFLRDVALTNLRERKNANTIARSQRPLIIITEDRAESYANLYKRMNDAMPDIPVAFENKAAQQKFERAKFYMAGEFNHRVIGHFVQSDDYYASPLCVEIQKSDCVMVFGAPQQPLQKELNRHGNSISSDTINMFKIEAMKRNTEAWASWNKNLQQRPSL